MKRNSALVALLFFIISAMAQTGSDKARLEACACLATDDVELVANHEACSVYRPCGGQGYVVVLSCADGDARVVGLSHTGCWNEDRLPLPLKEWISWLGKKQVNNTARLFKRSVKGEARSDISPLLSTHWHQSSPYNDLCPVIEDGHVKTAAGCVAIAAAQIVNYWHRDNPQSLLKDTPVYPYGAAPVTLSLPKGTPNDWTEILDEYNGDEPEECQAAVARLVYAIGTTSYLSYGSSTGGQIEVAANAMYSQYALRSESKKKSLCSQSEWETMIYENLSRDCPVLYAGNTAGGSGHAVVVDGYDSHYGLFHFNFGWGGDGDGFYTVDDETGMNGYCVSQTCVQNIRPSKRNITVELNFLTDALNPDCYRLVAMVTNNSTLALNSLCVYMDDNASEIVPDAIIECDVANDGRTVDVTFPLSVAEPDCPHTVVIKDEDGCELLRKQVVVSKIDECRQADLEAETTTYDLLGRIANRRDKLHVVLKKKQGRLIKVAVP